MTTWAETIGFWFAVPSERIYGNIYVLARPNVGATISAVNVVQGMNPDPYTADFTDPQMDVPCPDSMAAFSLPSGLSVDVYAPPTGYRFRYASIAGTCGMDLELTGCMPAWDPTDPSENPLLDEHPDLGLGDAWAGGHLDVVGRVRGSLTLRGATYDVDAMGGLDRSWSWAWSSRARRSSAGRCGSATSTTVDGVHGITGATMTARHASFLPADTDITVTDVRGRTHAFHGSAVAGAPWYSFSPSYLANQAFMRYEHDGTVAHGLLSDVWGIEFLAARRSRHGRRGTGR